MQYNVVAKVTKEFLKWLSYAEKNSSKYIGESYDKPGSFLDGAGDKNYTIFSKLYLAMTGINVQAQPWCDTFIDVIFIHLFGYDNAKKLLGGFSAYTPTSANYFKAMKRWTTGEPKEGYIGFFKNTERIYHTFYVISYKDGIMTTVEGNTGGLTGVVENGGCVAKKTYDYAKYKNQIAGFGMPDYSLVEEYKAGWLKAADGVRWWYQRSDGTYPANKWCTINGNYYLFDDKGYMLTGKQIWHDEIYLLHDDRDSQFEGACLHETDKRNGSMEIWHVDLPDEI